MIGSPDGWAAVRLSERKGRRGPSVVFEYVLRGVRSSPPKQKTTELDVRGADRRRRSIGPYPRRSDPEVCWGKLTPLPIRRDILQPENVLRGRLGALPCLPVRSPRGLLGHNPASQYVVASLLGQTPLPCTYIPSYSFTHSDTPTCAPICMRERVRPYLGGTACRTRAWCSPKRSQRFTGRAKPISFTVRRSFPGWPGRSSRDESDSY